MYKRQIQGDADQYGTIEQIRAIARGSGGAVDTVMIPGIGHSPYREAPDATLEALTRFLGQVRIVKNSAS